MKNLLIPLLLGGIFLLSQASTQLSSEGGINFTLGGGGKNPSLFLLAGDANFLLSTGGGGPKFMFGDGGRGNNPSLSLLASDDGDGTPNFIPSDGNSGTNFLPSSGGGGPRFMFGDGGGPS